MGRFLIWLSGADRDVLDRCKRLGHSERIRFAGLGSLVLVPAVLGFVGMTYAVSLVVNNALIYFAAGATWAIVVALIDRYIVSTLYKSKLNRGRRGRIVAVMARLVFAILVSIAISHPLLLLWFDATITQELDEQRRAAVDERMEKADEDSAAEAENANDALAAIAAETEEARAAAVSAAESASTALGGSTSDPALTDAIARRNCLESLLFAEQSGGLVSLPCGQSSGIPECARRCDNIRLRLQEVDEQIAELTEQFATQGDAAATEQARIARELSDRLAQINGKAEEDIARVESAAAGNVAEIESVADDEVDDIREAFSYDYLARVNALGRIADQESHVTTVTAFMFVFFLFVDAMPLTLKVTTQSGEYEEHRDTALATTEEEQRAEQEQARSSLYKDLIAVRAQHQSAVDQSQALFEVMTATMKTHAGQMLSFGQLVKDGRRMAAQRGVLDLFEAQIPRMRDIMAVTSETVLADLEKHLRNI